MATMGPKKSRSGISGTSDMQAVASLAVLAKVHAEVRADINPDLLNAIREHETANAAWLATSDGDLPTGTMEKKAADQAEKKLIHLPCHSHADVLAKVDYLYQQNTEAARAVHDTVQTDYLDEFLGSLVGIGIGEDLDGLNEPVIDPLLEAINAFRAELARFNAASLDSNEAAQEFAAQTFEPRLKVLVEWKEPAVTLDGAKEALRLMVEEIECFERPEALASLLRAAFGYLEGSARVSAGCASANQTVVAASPTIPEMYEEWLAVRNAPSDRTDEEMDEGLSRYQILQARIIAAEPQTPRDVAIMFIVDSDYMESDFSDIFKTRIREIEVGRTSNEAAASADIIEALFREWMSVSQNMSSGDTPYIHAEKLKQYGSLRERITGMRPATARELAIMLYVETTAGCSDCSDDFMTHVFALAGLENNNVSQEAVLYPSVGGSAVEAMPAPLSRCATRAAIEIDDIQTAAGCLHALLVSVYEVSTEIQYLLPDGSRDLSAERLNCLIILARDEAERIDQQVEVYIDSEKAKGAGQ